MQSNRKKLIHLRGSGRLTGDNSLRMSKPPYTASVTRTRGVATFALCMLTVVAVAIGLISHHATVLERRIAMDFKAVEIRTEGIPNVHLSGFCGNSSMSVKNVTFDREPHSVTVLIHIFLTRKGTTGNFSFDVPIPEGIDEIRFGKERVIVWRRTPN